MAGNKELETELKAMAEDFRLPGGGEDETIAIGGRTPSLVRYRRTARPALAGHD
jgi:hypothetical protein